MPSPPVTAAGTPRDLAGAASSLPPPLRGSDIKVMRGDLWCLPALLVVLLVTGRASAQPGTVIVELRTPPASLKLPAVARRTGAAAAAQRLARLGVASAAATAEQSSFRSAARATGLPIHVHNTYRYVSLAGTTRSLPSFQVPVRSTPE